MRILNQPLVSKIGDELKGILNDNVRNNFDVFYLIVAYVRQSGLIHLRDSILKFKISGGKIKAVVGIDQKLTSIQALQLLLSFCDEISVYHNEKPVNTFHPKIYAFERIRKRGIVFVGSSNLTEGGLYTNYESNSYAEYDLTKTNQKKEFAVFKQMFENYSRPSKLSKKLTNELIKKLSKSGYLSDEEKGETAIRKSMGRGKTQRSALFGTETIHAPYREHLTLKQKPSKKQKKKNVVMFSGKLLWLKENLPSSDVQDVKKGTAPTGGLRLTQANWKVSGNVIDQTTYFRQTVFVGLDWKKEKTAPFVEVAEASFRLRIDGKEIGQQTLKIRHKPSGEAGQHNYTTLISWGKFNKQIGSLRLTGKTLSLYAPPDVQKEPFLISIE